MSALVKEVRNCAVGSTMRSIGSSNRLKKKLAETTSSAPGNHSQRASKFRISDWRRFGLPTTARPPTTSVNSNGDTSRNSGRLTVWL